ARNLMARNREADEEPSRDTECAGQLGEKTAYSATAGFVAKLGDVMIRLLPGWPWASSLRLPPFRSRFRPEVASSYRPRPAALARLRLPSGRRPSLRGTSTIGLIRTNSRLCTPDTLRPLAARARAGRSLFARPRRRFALRTDSSNWGAS